MKYLFTTCVSILSFISIQQSFAQNNHKNGFYITGKVGASILQQKNQRYLGRYQSYNDMTNSYENYNYYNSQPAGTHTNTRLGGGIAIGYNFDNNFDVPIRAEIDVMARMRDSSNYFSGRQTYNYFWMATTEEQNVNNKVQLNTFMFNAFYDFKNKSAFTPYLMGGVGLASFKHTSIFSNSSATYDNNDGILYNNKTNARRSRTANNFAWNVGAGVKYKISQDFDLDLSYRYLGAGKSSLTMWRAANPSSAWISGYEKSKIKVFTQDIMLGLTYNF